MTEDEKKLCNIFAEISNRKNATEARLESRIGDFELDSLDIVEILMKIYEEFNVDIPTEKFIFFEKIMDVDQEIKRFRT